MLKPCIIITRPIEDSKSTAKLFVENNLDFFIEPMLTTQVISTGVIELSQDINKYSGVIITSKNALRAISEIDKNIKIICLGTATNAYAQKKGFLNVINSGNNVEDLCKYIKSNYKGKLFAYAAGETITKELTKTNCGNNIVKIVVYKTIATKEFTKDFEEKLQSNEFAGILFMSQKTAEIFYQNIKMSGLESLLANLCAFCLSKKISGIVKSYGFKATTFPKKSNMNAIIKLIIKYKFS